MIVLQDKDLLNVHRSYHTLLPLVPENHNRLLLGHMREIVQDYRWAHRIEYEDSQERIHYRYVITCQEPKPDRQGKTSTTTFKWLTNFIPTD
jgi:hypothetical protein